MGGAELLKETASIDQPPFFDDLPVSQSEDADLLESDMYAGRRQTFERPQMGARCRKSRHDLVAVDHDIVDGFGKVRECDSRGADGLLDAFRADPIGQPGMVPDKGFREDLAHRIEVAKAPDILMLTQHHGSRDRSRKRSRARWIVRNRQKSRQGTAGATSGLLPYVPPIECSPPSRMSGHDCGAVPYSAVHATPSSRNVTIRQSGLERFTNERSISTLRSERRMAP
jgi:hypothetical protein